ncbi:hypothetical protein MTO96_036336 [Rhipicephalus appendiculatus]
MAAFLKAICHIDFCGGPPVRRLLGLGRRHLVPRRARNPGIVHESSELFRSMKMPGKDLARAPDSPVSCCFCCPLL